MTWPYRSWSQPWMELICLLSSLNYDHKWSLVSGLILEGHFCNCVPFWIESSLRNKTKCFEKRPKQMEQNVSIIGLSVTFTNCSYSHSVVRVTFIITMDNGNWILCSYWKTRHTHAHTPIPKVRRTFKQLLPKNERNAQQALIPQTIRQSAIIQVECRVKTIWRCPVTKQPQQNNRVTNWKLTNHPNTNADTETNPVHC